MSLVSVNNEELKTPTGYLPSIEILEKSERNATGTLLREIIAEKIKISLSWNYMTQAELSKLQSIRKLKEFQCTYWDSESGDSKTIKCYCGSINATPIRADENGVVDWKDISTSFIEY